jgi:hypothetical protein
VVKVEVGEEEVRVEVVKGKEVEVRGGWVGPGACVVAVSWSCPQAVMEMGVVKVREVVRVVKEGGVVVLEEKVVLVAGVEGRRVEEVMGAWEGVVGEREAREGMVVGAAE